MSSPEAMPTPNVLGSDIAANMAAVISRSNVSDDMAAKLIASVYAASEMAQAVAPVIELSVAGAQIEAGQASRSGRRPFLGAVAGVAMLAVACGGRGGETPTTLNAQPAGQVSKSLLNVLNPQNVQVHCAALAAPNKFDLDTFDRGDGSIGVAPRLEYMAPVGPGEDRRISSDAMGTRFVNRDVNVVDREKAAVMCADPVQLVAMATFLANMEVGGVKVGDLNPRLKKYMVGPDKIAELAAEFVPLFGETRAEADIPAGEIEAALAAHREQQHLADLVSQMLAGFKPVGIVRSSATDTLHLANKGMKTGAKGLPVVEAVKEKDGMFVRLDLIDKGAECPEVSIGLNIGVNGKVDGGDKRPGMLPDQCEEETSETTAGFTPTTGVATTVTRGNPTSTVVVTSTTNGNTTTTRGGNTTTTNGNTTTTVGNTTTTARVTSTTNGNTTTTVGNTTTTEGGGKNHTESPVSDNPNDPDERVRPNVPPDTEPVRPVPAIPDVVEPNRGDSGTGAVNTVPTPVTVAPPASVPPAQPPVQGTVAPR